MVLERIINFLFPSLRQIDEYSLTTKEYQYFFCQEHALEYAVSKEALQELLKDFGGLDLGVMLILKSAAEKNQHDKYIRRLHKFRSLELPKQNPSMIRSDQRSLQFILYCFQDLNIDTEQVQDYYCSIREGGGIRGYSSGRV